MRLFIYKRHATNSLRSLMDDESLMDTDSRRRCKILSRSYIHLKAGANPNVFNSMGESLLYMAVTHRPRDVQKLKEYGAYVDAVDVERKTALHHAVLNANVVAVKALIELGANVSAIDKYGNTPVHLIGRKESVDKRNLCECMNLVLSKRPEDNVNSDGESIIERIDKVFHVRVAEFHE